MANFLPNRLLSLGESSDLRWIWVRLYWIFIYIYIIYIYISLAGRLFFCQVLALHDYNHRPTGYMDLGGPILFHRCCHFPKNSVPYLGAHFWPTPRLCQRSDDSQNATDMISQLLSIFWPRPTISTPDEWTRYYVWLIGSEGTCRHDYLRFKMLIIILLKSPFRASEVSIFAVIPDSSFDYL